MIVESVDEFFSCLGPEPLLVEVPAVPPQLQLSGFFIYLDRLPEIFCILYFPLVPILDVERGCVH